jgi:hypothetical protein
MSLSYRLKQDPTPHREVARATVQECLGVPSVVGSTPRRLRWRTTSKKWRCHSIKLPECRSYEVKESRRFGGYHQEPGLSLDHSEGETHTQYFDEVLLRENGVVVKPKTPKGRSREVMWTVDLRILQDPSQSSIYKGHVVLDHLV